MCLSVSVCICVCVLVQVCLHASLHVYVRACVCAQPHMLVTVCVCGKELWCRPGLPSSLYRVLYERSVGNRVKSIQMILSCFKLLTSNDMYTGTERGWVRMEALLQLKKHFF